jgi:DNA-binding MarR family transcriptional regulator
MENGSDIDLISEERRLWRLFGVTYYALFNTKKQAIELVGIQIVRGWVLWGLKAMNRPATITEMSQILNRDRQATAQLLKRMEDDGLVERRKGPSKGSAITVSLTPNGEALLNRALENDKADGEIMTCLTSDERESLAHCLHKLRREALARSASRSQCYPASYASKIGLSGAEVVPSSNEGINQKSPGP